MMHIHMLLDHVCTMHIHMFLDNYAYVHDAYICDIQSLTMLHVDSEGFRRIQKVLNTKDDFSVDYLCKLLNNNVDCLAGARH